MFLRPFLGSRAVAAGLRSRPGLVVRFDELLSDEIVRRDGVAVTSALRTAFDLARSRERDDAVIALDALARVGRFPPRRVVRLGYRHMGARGKPRLPALVALADRLSGSPMETRIRLALHDAGLPAPRLQVPVGPYFLDLGYDDALLGIEHDGGHHREAAQARRDLRRQAHLTRAGWHVLRFSARTVLRTPDKLAEEVAAALAARR